MKRLLFILLFFCFLLPQAGFSQGYDNISGGMTIETVKYKEKVKKKRVRKPLKPIEPGLQHNVTWGMYLGDVVDIDLDYIAGYRVNKYLYAGAGIGLDFNLNGRHVGRLYTITYDDYNSLYTPLFSIPLYIHCRIYMSKKRFQPFFALSMGGDIRLPLREEAEVYGGREYNTKLLLTNVKFSTSGLFMEPMLGLDVRLSSKVSINLQLGSKISSLPSELKFTDPTHAYIANRTFPNFSFKLGCTF
ncbi:MAG: hypothetical protein IJY44_05785 [Bacteroidaceae bacterium]|nr:hypothetical protein [Bacteroidaceae bacterium]